MKWALTFLVKTGRINEWLALFAKRISKWTADKPFEMNASSFRHKSNTKMTMITIIPIEHHSSLRVRYFANVSILTKDRHPRGLIAYIRRPIVSSFQKLATSMVHKSNFLHWWLTMLRDEYKYLVLKMRFQPQLLATDFLPVQAIERWMQLSDMLVEKNVLGLVKNPRKQPSIIWWDQY